METKENGQQDIKKKSFGRKLLKEYDKPEAETYDIGKKLAERHAQLPITLLEKAEAKKTGIRKRLEDSDKQLGELIDLGNELVTNIKVANDKREILRRNYEAIKREELLADLQNESVEAMAKLEAITEQWTELDGIKEPMGLYEELDLQKQRISELMQQKDDIIKECQNEIRRADAKYYMDLDRQSADIYCLVERIDNQIEIIKRAYNDHIELLQETIENERKSMADQTSRKWEDMYNKRSEDQKMKVINEKEKSAFYASEIDRISLQHQELTRATRIRLEKDAETLQLELRNIKNNVLLNSEKLDYNYQVLQKRDEENIIIRNQQKHRLAELNETISNLKKKIAETTTNSDAEIRRLKSQVSTLQRNINDLEKKAENFSAMDDKKYQTVWELNLKEAADLLQKVLDIDRILHEQQLGLEWSPPPLPPTKMKDFPPYKHFFKQTAQRATDLEIAKKREDGSSERESMPGKTPSETRILKSILRKISDSAGFLIEEKLLEILKPYTDQQRMLVRIDNIFNALGIEHIEDINALVDYFQPYTWCPNCSSCLSDKIMQELVELDLESEQCPEEEASPNLESDEKELALVPFKKDERSLDSKYTISEGSSTYRSDERIEDTVKKAECPNHYLVIEHAFVLTALRKYTENHLFGQGVLKSTRASTLMEDPLQKQRNTVSRMLTRSDVEQFWSIFPTIFPEQKQKLWKSLQYGLNHYMKVLKQRETLDSECEFLRRQNAELKHLLQRYMPNDQCTC